MYNVCRKYFSTSGNLNRHVLIHTDEKPCNVCQKSFHANHKLKRHVSTHISEKPYACSECHITLSSK